MATYIFRRLLLMIPTLIGITLLSFVIINLAPGSPVEQKLQQLRMGGAMGGGAGAGGGLGGLIDVARTQQRVDQIFTALLLSSLMGLFLMFVVRCLEVLILKFRPLSAAERSF